MLYPEQVEAYNKFNLCDLSVDRVYALSDAQNKSGGKFIVKAILKTGEEIKIDTKKHTDEVDKQRIADELKRAKLAESAKAEMELNKKTETTSYRSKNVNRNISQYDTDNYTRQPTIPSYSGGPVQVKGYYRKDGTYVKPHTRSAPKR